MGIDNAGLMWERERERGGGGRERGKKFKFNQSNLLNFIFNDPSKLKLNFLMTITKFFKLNNGKTIPSIGLGTCKKLTHIIGESVKAGEAVTIALKEGYRHIDCAAICNKEINSRWEWR